MSKNRLGKSRDACPVIGTWALMPASVEGAATTSMYILGELRVGHVKTGPADDRVDLVLSTILGHDAVRPHLANAVGDDLDIGPGKRRIEVIGQ